MDPLQGFPIVLDWTVAWGDMDAYGHVNNTVYFRYFENARMAYFEHIGWPAVEAATGLGPILASTSARFRKPLTHPDVVRIGARISSLADDRFTMDYCIVSRKLNAVAAEGQGVIVVYHHGEQRKGTLPAVLRQRIEELQNPGKGAHS